MEHKSSQNSEATSSGNVSADLDTPKRRKGLLPQFSPIRSVSFAKTRDRVTSKLRLSRSHPSRHSEKVERKDELSAKSNSSVSSTQKNIHKIPFYDSPAGKFISQKILKHPYKWWSIVMFIFTFFLLFGASIRDLCCTKEKDVAFDVIFSFTFVMLVVDIVLHCLATPEYFQWYFPCNRQKWFTIGSFIFWCDVLSTLVLLADISFIDIKALSMEHRHITQIDGGLGLSNNELLSMSIIRPKWNFLLAILRGARIGRLVRLIAVKNALQLNWNVVLNFLFPHKKVAAFCGYTSQKVKHDRVTAACKIQFWWRQQLKKPSMSKKIASLVPELEADEMKEEERRQRKLEKDNKRQHSHVGSAMREITAHRVIVGIMAACIVTVILTHSEKDETGALSMLFLHQQISTTSNTTFIGMMIDVARNTSLPTLYQFSSTNLSTMEFNIGQDPSTLRDREILNVTIELNGFVTSGLLSIRDEVMSEATAEIIVVLFLLIIWLISVMAFVGPVMTLVVVPIERMIRLLGMLMMDPLGYQGTKVYRRFRKEEELSILQLNWGKDVLKGMETSFLMSTILRIGSLMKVGFGSAGVEIIRKHLEKGRKSIKLSQAGSTVSCIFLFCDIRQFTDATECLQEEVFVFTNKIAAVVHSICNAHGGSANKNIGDAFLLSWLLKDEAPKRRGRMDRVFEKIKRGTMADKALLSVVKICLALHHDNYFLEGMSEKAKNRLLTKLANRPGPVVQLGCGLHAGKAVQGAIGTQRKLDPTYLSEAVEFAECLESCTKSYGVKVLMSDSFHTILNSANRRKCRKVDQIKVDTKSEDGEDNIMDLYTFDMDIDALWTDANAQVADEKEEDETQEKKRSNTRRRSLAKQMQKVIGNLPDEDEEDSEEKGKQTSSESKQRHIPKLVLPSGPVMYSESVWLSETMQTIRHQVNDDMLLQVFGEGLKSYFGKDWDAAKSKFTQILDKFEDGPSRLYMKRMEKHNGIPPPDFNSYNEL